MLASAAGWNRKSNGTLVRCARTHTRPEKRIRFDALWDGRSRFATLQTTVNPRGHQAKLRVVASIIISRTIVDYDLKPYLDYRALLFQPSLSEKGRESGNSLRSKFFRFRAEDSFRSFDQLVKGECPVMKNQLKSFIKDESGQDVAEYAMLLVLVAIAIAIASPTITEAVLSVFSLTKSVLGV